MAKRVCPFDVVAAAPAHGGPRRPGRDEIPGVPGGAQRPPLQVGSRPLAKKREWSRPELRGSSIDIFTGPRPYLQTGEDHAKYGEVNQPALAQAEAPQNGSAQRGSRSSADSEPRGVGVAPSLTLPGPAQDGDRGPAPTGQSPALLQGDKLSCRAVPRAPVLVSLLEKQVVAAADLRKQWETKGQAIPPLPLPSELYGLILRLLCESGVDQQDLRPCLLTLRAMGRVCRFFCLVLARVIAQLPEEFRRQAAHFEDPLLQESACTDASGQDLRQWAGNFLGARWELKQEPSLTRTRSAFHVSDWLPASVFEARSFDPLPDEIDVCALNSERLDEWESVLEKCGDRVPGLRIGDTVPDTEQEARQAGVLALCRNLRRLTIRSSDGRRERVNYRWMEGLAELRELRIDSPRWPSIPAAALRRVERLSLSRTQWDALCAEPEMLDCFDALKELQILGDSRPGEALYLPAGLTQLSTRFFSDICANGTRPVPAGLTGLELHYRPRDEEKVSYRVLLRQLSSHACPPNPVLCRILQSERCRLRRLHVKHALSDEREVFSALASNRSLRELQVNPIYLMPTQVGPLVEFLRGHPGLQVLRLTFSVRRMWLDQVQGLVDAIARHPGLRVVSLDFDKLQSSLHHYDERIEQQLLKLPRRNKGLLELDFKLRPRGRGLLNFRFSRRAYLRDEPGPASATGSKGARTARL